MQPRSLQQVLTELDSVYTPQIDNLRQRQAAIPGQIQAEEEGLNAKQQTAFGDILNGARRRGMGFSGIPLQEQARYTADNYMPALARLKQSGREQAMSLEDAILGIQERRQTQGQSIYQFEQQAAEQRRQFDEQMAAQRRQAAAQQAAMASFGYGGQPQETPSGGAQMVRRENGGFNFTNEYGNAISAAAYAAKKQIPFRDLLQIMARQGDKGAQSALGFVGNDFGYDRNKVKSQDQVNLYNSLVWGAPNVNQASIARPVPQPRPAVYQPAVTMSQLPIPSLIRR